MQGVGRPRRCSWGGAATCGFCAFFVDELKSRVGFLYVSLSLLMVVWRFRNPRIFDG